LSHSISARGWAASAWFNNSPRRPTVMFVMRNHPRRCPADQPSNISRGREPTSGGLERGTLLKTQFSGARESATLLRFTADGALNNASLDEVVLGRSCACARAWHTSFTSCPLLTHFLALFDRKPDDSPTAERRSCEVALWGAINDRQPDLWRSGGLLLDGRERPAERCCVPCVRSS
jgi:hypothetical protein